MGGGAFMGRSCQSKRENYITGLGLCEFMRPEAHGNGEDCKRTKLSFLCMLLVSSSMGCVMDSGDDTYNPRILLQINTIDTILQNGSYHWNAEIEINEVIMDDNKIVQWDEIEFRMGDRIWYKDPISQQYNGTPPTTPGLHLYNNDTNGRQDTPDDGDLIMIFGMSRRHQGCALILSLPNILLSKVRFPSIWNETFTVDLVVPLVSLEQKGNWSWSVEIQILQQAPSWEHVPWDDIDVGWLPHVVLDFPDENLAEELPSLRTIGVNGLDRQKIMIQSIDDFISAGDTLIIKNLSQNPGYPIIYAGEDLVILTGNVLLGHTQLPEVFPDP
jgi:hypothetical protein